MQKTHIKQKLNDFLENFCEERGGFKSLEVIYNYINFLKSEKNIKDIIKEVWLYADEQKESLSKELKNIKKEHLVLNPNNSNILPFFAKEQEKYYKQYKDKDDTFNVNDLTPVMLANLMMVYDLMDSLKNDKLSGLFTELKNLNTSELLESAKEESMGFQSIPVLPDKKLIIDNANFYQASIELINKYIIDHIDSEEFLKKPKSQGNICFDKESSILSVYGEEIKIRRRSDNPYDHYILEYIFEQSSIFDETDFVEIAKDKLGILDYDNIRDSEKIRHACDRLNTKIKKATKHKINKFLEYRTGKAGWCRINRIYQ